MIIIEENKDKKSEICNQILRTLPDWFGIESAIVDYVKDVKSMITLVAMDNHKAIGFLSLNFHNVFTAEIHIMGILPEFHRKGIGKNLVLKAEEILRKQSFRFLTVKTLSESNPDKNYARTRKFYSSIGFIPIEEFRTLWGEANPCLMLIKPL
ncbi:MAG: GNAT family N-acetyltransferase [Bdellovibrionales bacterium]|nr:GNAT family N-acetyltransferase [Bdellovibrionales bacterium]